jgi:hypothetical protein
MKVHDIIAEMSQIIDPVSSVLSQPKYNLEKYKKFMQTVKYDPGYTIVGKEGNVIVYNGKKDHVHQYIAVDPDQERIVYKMEFDVYSHRLLGRYVVQQWLWADPAYRLDLPSKIFEELLEDYRTVVCDAEQTELGKAFWIKQLHKAFSRNLNIYYVDLENNQLIAVPSAADILAFDHKYKIWTRADSSANRLFVISHNQLRTTK